jgi:uncharacterized protein (DUF2235 family)
MSKSIVVCIDGTNNDPTSGRTNVSRFFRILDKTKTDQIGYYQPGVGTLDPDNPSGKIRQKVKRVRDLAKANQIKRHVTSAYRYLMQVYKPGDRIYLVGFSRGAYTCRVLAGMLHKVGLLYRGQEEMVPFAWEVYRKNRNPKSAGRFKKYYSRTVRVEFLGIWDTVSSIGSRFNPQTFPNTFNNRSVQCIRHAIALDEHRATYATNLWDDTPSKGQSVEQVWFAGVHSDVGGGYSGDKALGLGAIPLKWMLREAHSAGIRFIYDEEIRLIWEKAGRVPKDHSIRGVTEVYIASEVHDELKRTDMLGMFWKAVERVPLPRRYKSENDQWKIHWKANRGEHRFVPTHTKIHGSVLMRKELVPEYNPPNLPSVHDESRICW